MNSTSPAPAATAQHTWRFFSAGGFDQVRLETGADLLALDQLDQKLWVALACPTRGVEFDPRTLDLIDTDKDGRIRPPELIAALKWTGALLRDPDSLVRGSPELPLGAINDATPEGARLLASAKQILANLGKPGALAVSAADTADTTRIFAQTRFNGDGIVPADAADDPKVQVVIGEILMCLGADTDRSGKPGVSQAKVDQFLAEAEACSAWHAMVENDRERILPLGDATAGAAAALQAVRAKVDDYFTRCRLAAFDPRALTALNRQENEYLALSARDLSSSAAEVAGFPLARIEAGRALPLQEGVNPAWAGALVQLRERVIKPVLGERTVLTAEDWQAVCSRFGPYLAWMATKAGAAVEGLGLARVREILSGGFRETLSALIAKDRALEPEANAVAGVDKLVRFHRDLSRLCHNFVNFHEFYSRSNEAIFQAGRLFLDTRSCDLCLVVDDPARHAALAGLAGTYLAYCDCARKGSNEKLTIVAAFTAGDAGDLLVGRNGVFYDRKGRDWDATITRIVDTPISIRQAFFDPYRKGVRWIEEQVAKRAATADTAAQAKLAATTPAAPAAPAAPKKFDVGTVAALGVGLGAIGTILGGFVAGFLKLSWWQMPLAILGVLLAISLPSVLIAWLKLRQRSLGPILDANGWAVNSKARMNVPFGGSLTNIAELPPGAERSLEDPYAQKNRGGSVLFWVVLLALVLGGFAWWNWKQKQAAREAAPPATTTNAPVAAP